MHEATTSGAYPAKAGGEAIVQHVHGERTEGLADEALNSTIIVIAGRGMRMLATGPDPPPQPF